MKAQYDFYKLWGAQLFFSSYISKSSSFKELTKKYEDTI